MCSRTTRGQFENGWLRQHAVVHVNHIWHVYMILCALKQNKLKAGNEDNKHRLNKIKSD